MSSVKLQALIRKFKSVTKEVSEKNKIITNYQHNVSLESVLDTQYLFTSNKLSAHTYSLVNNTECSTVEIDASIYDYINTYLSNVFNSELCSETWLINTYVLHTIHHNFIVNDNVHIKSLHIGDINELSAFNHYIHNGVLPELINPEWQWLSISSGNTHTKKKYANNILQLLDVDIHTANNINYVVNEVNDKFNKINFLCNTYTNVNICNNYGNNLHSNKSITSNLYNNCQLHLTNAILAIKVMEVQGICWIQIPNVHEWDTAFINVLLLYCLLFTEVYVFTFDLLTRSTYILCKTKKKINNETTYKKLLYIILNKEFTSATNLFAAEVFTQPDIMLWLQNIKQIQNNQKSIIFSDVIAVVNDVCQINTHTFL